MIFSQEYKFNEMNQLSVNKMHNANYVHSIRVKQSPGQFCSASSKFIDIPSILIKKIQLPLKEAPLAFLVSLPNIDKFSPTSVFSGGSRISEKGGL